MNRILPALILSALCCSACSGEAEVSLRPDAPDAGISQDMSGSRPRDMTPPAPDMAPDMRAPQDMAPSDMRPTPDMAPQDMGVDMAPMPGEDMAPAPPITVAIVSDLNGSYGSTTYSSRVPSAVSWLVQDVRPDLVLSTGDMVAGQKAGLDYDAMWTSFHSLVTTPLTQAGIPFAPTPGNHDASGYASFQGERDRYITTWQARRPAVTFVEDTYFPLRYAFRMGDALFISLDDTIIAPLDQPQKLWLRGVLEANRDVPVKIVYGHVPLYAVAQGRESEALEDEGLESLLNEFSVDAFFAGHHHAYYPGRRGALRLATTGCLGGGARKLIGDSVTSAKSVMLVTIDHTGITSLEAYTGTGWTTRIARAGLPETITHNGYTVTRDDR